ncbi:hypothetical protein [Herpetosiphon sp. NSE202]|uniref:hypothetical protein n=1 Tax=Herpetosiphon sp. NSE202 TaxID=3351349 RepID=UPI00363910BD
MIIRFVLTGFAILVAWTVLDMLLHRLFLRPLYDENPTLWRPFDQLNTPLISAVTFILISIFITTYWLLINPKSLTTGLGFGALLGLALGIGSGGGTYIHLPIPRKLALGWLAGGWIKGIAAGTILGAMLH